MNDAINVEAARIPDRDRLVRELREAGLDAQPVDEIGIAVIYGDDPERPTEELFASVETVIMAIGAPFVPAMKDGVIYLRPPGD